MKPGRVSLFASALFVAAAVTARAQVSITPLVGGYVPASEQYEDTGQEQEVGVIPVDAIFSPVTRVRYKVEDTRVAAWALKGRLGRILERLFMSVLVCR